MVAIPRAAQVLQPSADQPGLDLELTVTAHAVATTTQQVGYCLNGHQPSSDRRRHAMIRHCQTTGDTPSTHPYQNSNSLATMARLSPSSCPTTPLQKQGPRQHAPPNSSPGPRPTTTYKY